MLQQFHDFIEKQALCSPAGNILLAVSGGVDSVALVELFSKADYPFAIAHCNFQLRGKESDEDEKFVQELADKLGVVFFSTKFETEKFARKKGISIQMAARELRYSWFEEIRKENGFDCIAVATHRNDEIETVLLNLTRGTGIAGLHGIFPKQGKIIRPLLFATRKEIEDFAKAENTQWREDSSNTDDKYLRNKIRNQVIPVLKEINPNLEDTFSENIRHIRDVEEIFRAAIEQKRKEIVTQNENEWKIPIEKLKELKPLKTWLYELLAPFGFNESTVSGIISALDEQSGKRFFSSTHCLLKDRTKLIIFTIENQILGGEIEIEKKLSEINDPVHLKFNIVEKSDFEMIKDKNVACLDYDKLQFPLKLRRWQNGDTFIPLGMEGKKKLSDFLIDEKISVNEKETIFVLVSGNEIAWVIDFRVSETFKVGNDTGKVFISELLF